MIRLIPIFATLASFLTHHAASQGEALSNAVFLKH